MLELPVNSRDFSRLALFSPAAKVSSSGVATLAFNGTDIAQNNFLLDGTDATHVDNAFMSNGRERGARLQTASSESIQEFRVLSTNYSAEYGRAAGGIFTDFTGRAFDYRGPVAQNQGTLAANPTLHAEALRRLANAGTSSS